MADFAAPVLRDADTPWNTFSAHGYWRQNYREIQAEDRDPVAGTRFPAPSITAGGVRDHLTALGTGGLRVELLKTKPGVRKGYAGMTVATGFACSQRGQ
jgi:hypothetical protein